MNRAVERIDRERNRQAAVHITHRGDTVGAGGAAVAEGQLAGCARGGGWRQACRRADEQGRQWYRQQQQQEEEQE